MSSLRAATRLSISAFIFALASGVNARFTYSWPRISPMLRSAARTQRSHRGWFSFVPERTVSLNAKSSSTNAAESSGAAASMTFQRR